MPTEEEEGLIDAIKDELDRFGRDFGTGILLHALEVVDLTERLGIQRYFNAEIERFLHIVSTWVTLHFRHCFSFNLLMNCTHDSSIMLSRRKWDAENGLRSPEATVAAFRLLRLHGYPVSAGN